MLVLSAQVERAAGGEHFDMLGQRATDRRPIRSRQQMLEVVQDEESFLVAEAKSEAS